MTRSRTAAAVVLITLVSALAGCASSAGAGPATTAAPSVEAPPPSSAAPAPSETTPAAAAPTTAPGAYVEYTDGAIEATAGAKALFFHASWCPQCRALDDDLTARGVPDGLTVFKVDYDARTDLRQTYGVTLQTTVVFVDDAGALISKTVLYDDPSVASLVAAMP